MGISSKFRLSSNVENSTVTMSLYPNTPIPSPTPSIQYPAIPAYSPVLSGQGEVSSNPPTIQEQPSNSGTLNFQDPDVQDLVFGGSGSDLKSEEGDFAGRDWKRTGIGVISHFSSFRCILKIQHLFLTAHTNSLPCGAETQQFKLLDAVS